jgi:acyl-CoA thioester hydrolase
MVVPESDIDRLGHASNVAYLRWIQEAATGHSERVGLDFDAYVELGAVFVVRRHEIDYLKPALAGDAVELETWIESWSAATSIRRTRILRGRDELVRAATTWAFVNATNGRPMRIPERVRDAFALPLEQDRVPLQE